MAPKISPNPCNFIGGTTEDLAARRGELPLGLDITPNPEDGQACWYAADTGQGPRFIAPFDFASRPQILAAPFAADSRYYLIPMYPNAEVNPLYRSAEYAAARQLRSQFAVFVEGDDRDTTRPGLETVLMDQLIRSAGDQEFGLHRIDLDPASTAGPAMVHLTSFNTDYNPPLPKAKVHPPVTPFYCPEYSLHRDPAEGDLRLEDWELYRDTDHPAHYRAIPRVEFQKEVDAEGRVERWKFYEEDLRSKLGYSDFLQGDADHFRYLRDIAFESAGGVVGLYCPAFQVRVDAYEMAKVSCLERFLRQPKDVIRGRTFVHSDGYLLPGEGRDTRRYFSHERRANPAQAGAKWLALRKDDPAKVVVDAVEVARQGQCVEYQLSARPAPDPTVSSKDQPVPEAPMSRPDIARVSSLMATPEGEAKVAAYGQLGPVTVALPPELNPGGLGLVDQIVASLDPTQRNELCLVIDQSGSMTDDIQTVRNQVEAAIQNRLGAGNADLSLCLVRFRDEDVDVLVPLDPNRGRAADIIRIHAGLDTILKDVNGGTEYITRAAELAVTELNKGILGSKRTIVVITDEPGDPWPAGTNLEEGLAAVRHHAEAIGAEFKIIMTANLEEESLLILLNTSDPPVREKVLQKIVDGSNIVRYFFAENLYRVNDPNARNRLAIQLAEDEYYYVRHAMARFIGDKPDKDLASRIAEKLAEDEHFDVRQAVADHIGDIPDKDLANRLAKQLAEDENYYVRLTVADHIGDIPDKALVNRLAEKLAEDEHFDVRHAVADHIGDIPDKTLASRIAKQLAEDEDYRVRRTVAEHIGDIPDKDLANRLAKKLAEDEDYRVRWAVADHIGDKPDKDLANHLAEKLAKDEDNFVRWTVARHIGDVPDPVLRARLREQLKAEFPWLADRP